jgi:hypothetical protein
VANTLRLQCNGAVGFIDWLDFRALLSNEFIIKFALAIYNLSAAHGTSLYVAAEDVKLAFPDAAIVTRPAIGSPIVFLIAIANAGEFLASDAEARLNRIVHYGLINLTRHKISDREPGKARHATKGWMANTRNASRSLARGSLHRLVRLRDKLRAN